MTDVPQDAPESKCSVSRSVLIAWDTWLLSGKELVPQPRDMFVCVCVCVLCPSAM